MKLHLAVDAGGSKTGFVLYGDDFLPRRIFSVGSMRRNTTPQALMDAHINLMLEILQKEGVTSLGTLSGTFFPDCRDALERTFHPDEIVFRNELQPALATALIMGDGTILLAGTGNGIHTCRNKETLCSGGWGAALGDDGSGYDIGRHAFRAIMHAYEEQAPATALTALLCERYGTENPWDAVFSIYAPDAAVSPVTAIASFCPAVGQAAQAGDAVAQSILREAGQALGRQYLHHLHHFGLPTGLPTTVSGSVWKGNPLYAESVLSVILEKIPDFALRPPLVEPVVGSVLCHGFACGIHDPDTLCRIAAAYPKPFLPCFSDGRMPQ